MILSASLAAGSLFGYVGYTRPAFANGTGTCTVEGNQGIVSGDNNAGLIQSLTDCIAYVPSGGTIRFDPQDVSRDTVINISSPIEITKSLTIQGSSTADKVWPRFNGTVGTTKSQLFYDSNSLGDSEQITFREIGLQNGYSDFYGGAIELSDNSSGTADLVLDSVRFSGNTSSDAGGGVYSAGHVSVVSTGNYVSRFQFNNTGGAGGAITAEALSINNAIFFDNYANKGGAVASITLSDIKNAEFEKNSSYLDGGAIFVLDEHDLDISNTTFSENEAGTVGGSISLSNRSTLDISNSDFTGNKADSYGGAIFGGESSTVYVSDQSVFRTNKTLDETLGESGGAVYLEQNSVLNVSNTLFDSNETYYYGGAIALANNADVYIDSSDFLSNDSDTFGGALFVREDSDVVLKSSYFSLGNAGLGGAVFVSDRSTSNIIGTKFVRNYSAGGGAVNLRPFADAQISESSFLNNASLYTGGAIFIDADSQIGIDSSTFYNNSSYVIAGAIMSGPRTNVSLTNSTLYKNSSLSSAAIYAHHELNIGFSTFYQNYRTGATDYDAVSAGSLTVSNSIIGGKPNTEKTATVGLDVYDTSFDVEDPAYFDFSLLTDLGNLKLDPVFVDGQFSHLIPESTSPVVRASNPNPALSSDSVLNFDQLGDKRSFPSNIGAIQSTANPPSFSAPVPTTAPILTLEEDKPFSQGETVVARVINATRVESVSIGDTEAEIISFEDGLLTFTVPELEAGSYSITGVFNSGTVIFDIGLEITSAVSSAELNVWTKKVSDTEAKVYAKNPVGNGKIQFFVDGEEIAWVRAEDGDDPKLSQAQGAYYLVRTVELTDSKQAIEIYVDGVRAWRAAYTNK